MKHGIYVMSIEAAPIFVLNNFLLLIIPTWQMWWLLSWEWH